MSKVVATIPKKQEKPKPKTAADVALIFLDEIEKNTVKSAESIKALTPLFEMLIKSVDRQTETLTPKPFPEQKAIDLSAVVNATLSVANQVLKSANQSDAVLSRKVDMLIEVNRAIIEQLKRIERPRKWEFNIDRNFSTGKIQKVIAEVVE